jgi:hypothetical protein
MFAGHIGAALAIARTEHRINPGWLVLAALLLDVLLWFFVLLGWEQVVIPANFAQTHQPRFVFPWSHGLLGSVVWSALAGVATFLVLSGAAKRRWTLAAWVSTAVFSHWLLDALVHGPELPLAGDGSTQVGLGLWNHMALGLAVETAILLGGLALYLRGAAFMSSRQRLGLVVLSLAVLVFTILGMTVAPAPPSAAAMPGSSLVTIGLICALMGWLTRSPSEASPPV